MLHLNNSYSTCFISTTPTQHASSQQLLLNMLHLNNSYSTCFISTTPTQHAASQQLLLNMLHLNNSYSTCCISTTPTQHAASQQLLLNMLHLNNSYSTCCISTTPNQHAGSLYTELTDSTRIRHSRTTEFEPKTSLLIRPSGALPIDPVMTVFVFLDQNCECERDRHI